MAFMSTDDKKSDLRSTQTASAPRGAGKVRGAFRRFARLGAGLAGLSLLALLYGGLQQGYRTDFPPPTGKETYAEVLPASIGGEAMAVRTLQLGERFHGARAEYGSGAAIEIVQTATQEDLDNHVNSSIRPRLDAYQQRVSGKVNGVWGLRGHGSNGRIYSWQNQRWLFVIEATSDALFEEVVDQFAYIERR